MGRMVGGARWWTVAGLSLVPGPAVTAAERSPAEHRAALVIGNANYACRDHPFVLNESDSPPPCSDSVRTHADGVVFRDDCPSCPEMVVIPAGAFMMGSGPEEGDPAERPRHRVRVDRFALGRYEVTRSEYRAFAEARGADGAWYGSSWRDPGFAQDDDHPVVNVSWEGAQAYVRWLSRETGERYRLPSEAEWEYAARGGTTTRRYWGDSSSQCGYANGADAAAKRVYAGWTWAAACDDGWVYTAPVGSFEANAFGLFDVLGNVMEWTEDCWHGNYARAPSDGTAWKRRGDCGRHVRRGGSWSGGPRLGSAHRYLSVPLNVRAILGFRVARTLDWKGEGGSRAPGTSRPKGVGHEDEDAVAEHDVAWWRSPPRSSRAVFRFDASSGGRG